ncbi:MAG: hypothetical protein ABII63_07100 [Pseudomonadota bacterium]
MDITGEKVAISLVVAAIAVLLVDQSFVEISAFSLSIGALELSEVKINSLLPPVVAVAFIIALLVYHVIYMFKALAPVFRDGYAECPKYQKLVGDAVARMCGSTKYGSPYGGMRHTLRRQTYRFGRFQHEMGYLTDPVEVTPSRIDHLCGVLYGLRRCINVRQFLAGYAPAILGVWALYVIAV